MANPVRIPEELVPVLRQWHEDFKELHPDCEISEELLPAIEHTVAASEFCASVILRDWSELSLASTFSIESIANACDAILQNDALDASAMLRQLRRRAHCHLLFDEIAGRTDTTETLQKISDVAEILIDAAVEVSRRKLIERFGELRDNEGELVPLLVLGMGKLGGGELNYSSDVDLVFVCPLDGMSDGRREMTAGEYCIRWSQALIPMLDDKTEHGFVYRVDTRLRPFGASGPPVASYGSLEAYFLHHGRVWERYAFLKARSLGHASASEASRSLFDELVNPFVYRGYLDYGLLDSLREMHRRIDAEKRGMLDNVKLGPGGIREIEFMVQSLQLLRGGANPALKTPSLLEALEELRDSKELQPDAVDGLRSHYLFLRRLENFIQARRDQQTHDLPTSELDRAALAMAMGFDSWAALAQEVDRVRADVALQFDSFAYRESDSDDDVSALFENAVDVDEWTAALQARDIPDAPLVARQLIDFREACMRRRVSGEALERLTRLLPLLLDELLRVPNAVSTLERCLKVLDNIVRRSAYISLLVENQSSLRRFVELVSQSKYIADEVTRYPALLDELLDPRLFVRTFERSQFDRDLKDRLDDLDSSDTEARVERLAQFQRRNMFRIAVCDVADDLSLMKTSDGLTWLAESVLDAALDEALLGLRDSYGIPTCEDEGVTRPVNFAIVAYGKLGGLELSYGSDLDLVFLHDARGSRQSTDGPKSVDNAVFFSRLVQRLTHMLTTRTSSGVLYEIDTRLRPSGRSGLLVSGIDAYERYQRDDAWTWEHQSLLRARAVAGDQGLCQEFEQRRLKILTDYTRRDSMAKDVASMRRKMRIELDQSSNERFDLKQGDGGVTDLEFVVQYLCLREAAAYPDVIEYSDNVRQIEALRRHEILDNEQAEALTEIYLKYRDALHRRVLDARDRTVNAQAFVEERRYVRRVWEAFLP